MSNTNNSYSTGYKCTVLVGTTTYGNAMAFDLPEYTAATVEARHFGGLQNIPDGIAGYGEPMIEIPLAGGEITAGLLTDTTLAALTCVMPAVTATGFSGATWIGGTNNCYVIFDTGGKVKRGSVTLRQIKVRLLNNPGTWTSP